jgi:DNA-binding MarR family transcriptional regulator
MRSLAESLHCDASYMTDLVDKLEQRGMIERRSSAEDRRVKLIALTGWGQQQDRDRTSAAGFDAHLVKPVAEAHLFRALATAIDTTHPIGDAQAG